MIRLLTFTGAALAAGALVASCDRGASRGLDVGAPGNGASGANAPAAQRAPERTVAVEPRDLPPRDALSDTMITGRIKASVLADPRMGGADITVNTDRGVVSLAGSVKSQEQIAVASAHAQRQDGVMRVDNHLSVKPQ